VLYGSTVEVVVSAVLAGVLAVLWYVIPLGFRLARRPTDRPRMR